MQLILVTVYDKALGCYQPPFSVRAKGEAIRNFQDATNNPQNNQLHLHPDDFELYIIGTYDDTNARITSHEPQLLATGAQLKG